MKILLLNPHVDASRDIAHHLKSLGHVVFLCSDATDAWQVLQLHVSSVDLALIHREEPDSIQTPGMTLLEQIRQDTRYGDLPVILTTEQWKELEAHAHQQSPQGAHGYLSWPVSGAQIAQMIGEIYEEGSPQPQPPQSLNLLPNAPIHLVLEEPAQVPKDIAGILFEQPPPEPLALETIEAPSAPDTAPEAAAEDPDSEAVQQMPYLFQKSWGSSLTLPPSFVQPVGDSIVPGGAAQSPDLETLKKYLLLREQDVAILSHQLKATQEQVAATECALGLERAQNAEHSHQITEQKRKIEEFDREKQLSLGALEKELAEVRFQSRAKIDRARILESQVRETTEEIERLKERVRSDIRRIRVREKELENRLEIMKKDSEALISARDQKIIELKRKVDILEFNMDLMQDQYMREKQNSSKLRQQLAKAAQVVRVAGGLLDASESSPSGEELESAVKREVS